MEESEISLGYVAIGDVVNALDKMLQMGIGEVSFEFIVNSFFPQVPINMLNNLQKEYDRGYKEGYYAAKELFYKLP